MPRKNTDEGNKTVELLQTLLVLQLYELGATQEKIAKTVGRQRLWVNTILKGLPRRGANRD